MSETIEEPIVPQVRRAPLSLSEKGLTGDIFRLALPAAGENLLLAMLMLADLIMVGHYMGSTGLSSVGFGTAMSFVVMILTLPLPIATNAIIARHVGARQMKRARHACGQAMLVAVVLGAAMSVTLTVLTRDILWAMGLDGDVYKFAVLYLKWIYASFVFRFLLLNAGAVIKGAGNTRTPMIVGGAANLLNIILDYGLIFGKFGLPEMGIEGAAIATAVSLALGSLVMCAMLFTDYSVVHMRWRHLKGWSWKMFRTLVKIAAPSMGEQALLQLGFIAYLRVVSELGKEALAAHFIGVRIEAFSFLPGLGFGMAAATLVGQGLGARKPVFAAKSMKRCALYGCLLMGLVGVLMFIFRYQLPVVFNPEQDVLNLTASCLLIGAVSQVPLALCLILSGGLRGAGDTLSTMVVAFAGVIAVRVPLGYLLALKWGMGLQGIWWASAADWTIRSIVVMILISRGRWRRIKV